MILILLVHGHVVTTCVGCGAWAALPRFFVFTKNYLSTKNGYGLPEMSTIFIHMLELEVSKYTTYTGHLKKTYQTLEKY